MKKAAQCCHLGKYIRNGLVSCKQACASSKAFILYPISNIEFLPECSIHFEVYFNSQIIICTCNYFRVYLVNQQPSQSMESFLSSIRDWTIKFYSKLNSLFFIIYHFTWELCGGGRAPQDHNGSKNNFKSHFTFTVYSAYDYTYCIVVSSNLCY